MTALLPATNTTTDILLIGAGVAGLSFALSVPPDRHVTLVSKGALGESNTRYAQGGVAAAVADTDSPASHLHDTVTAGAGLVDVDAARVLVEGGPDAIRWLIDLGTRFDRDGDALALGHEGAHSQPRVLHAGGDATGAEIERSLVAQLPSHPNVRVLTHSTATDLLVQDHRCNGVRLLTAHGPVVLHAATTVLALGGAGQLWGVTSNPRGATGDGIAMALRAGVTVADLEFTQFHPTVLAEPGQEPFLISEAVRGDGALLRDDAGHRFMPDVDPRAELAPRDIVARAIHDRIEAGSRVFLDLRHLDAGTVRRRFPTIAAQLVRSGLDLATDLIPVAPAAHYFMGGIAAAPDGRTSMANLLAIGEVACTGVNGANRLASNSLLEGLVFGRLAAERLASTTSAPRAIGSVPPPGVPSGDGSMAVSDARASIRLVMREHVSVVRSETSLRAATSELRTIATRTDLVTDTPGTAECRNMWLLANEIARSALYRQESRGGHVRDDFPQPDPALEGRHQLVRLTHDGAHRYLGTLAEVWQGAIDGSDPS